MRIVSPRWDAITFTITIRTASVSAQRVAAASAPRAPAASPATATAAAVPPSTIGFE